MSAPEVRVGPTHGGTLPIQVHAGEDGATVAVSRRATPLVLGHPGNEPATSTRPVRLPDPAAWPAETAAEAAASRWKDPHPAVRTVTALSLGGPARPGSGRAAELVEAAGAELAGRGVRRLDLRFPADDPLAADLVGPRWVQGRVGSDVVASLALAYPWTDAPDPDARLQSVLAPLPPRLRRVVRRVAAVRPGQVPELVRSTSTEAAAAVRSRYRPGNHHEPVAGAPAGSHPFAASRYRTVRAALALVPAPLRAAPFVDVGCGDGRVLTEALQSGFPRVLGRELDPDLAQRAAEAVGHRGEVQAGDALAAPLADDAKVVFLNNPFDVAGVARLAERIAETLARRPRPLLVLYLNPRPIEALLDAGLVLVHVDPRFSVLASAAEP